MTCLRIPNQDDSLPDGFLCLGGPFYAIDVKGRRYAFEIPLGCGISPMNKDGMGRLSPWPRVVWGAVGAWSEGGGRVDDEGVCVWTEEDET